MKQSIVFVLLFTAGFLVHALFFPDVLYDALHTFQEVNTKIPQKEVVKNDDGEEKTSFFTYINYDGSSFDKRNVNIKLGNYLAITNMSREKGMHLESDNPLLQTGRSYGYYERVQTRMDEVGIYHVLNKLNPQATIKIIVR